MELAIVLAEAGVADVELEDPDALLPLETHRRIGIALLARVPPGSLPELVTRTVSPSTFGLIGKIAQHSETLLEALTVLVRYQQLLLEGAALTLRREVEGGQRSVVFVAEVPPTMVQLREPLFALFAAVLTLCRKLCAAEVTPNAVCFAMPAEAGDVRRLAPLFGVRPRFSRPRHAILFPEPLLTAAIPGARSDRVALLSAYADDLLSDHGSNATTAAAVRRTLVTSLPRGVTRQEAIARELGMSPRTMSRRLKDEGTTFGKTLEAVRRELAPRFLRDPSLSVREVAFLLGYTDPSTFFGAFKRWTGKTPRAWRSRPDFGAAARHM